MFGPEPYIARRRRLEADVKSGLVLLLGNDESPMNYPDNPYPFRQDSSFLYFFGLACPGLAGVIDIDEQSECVFGDDVTVDEIIWTGPQPALREKCGEIGVNDSALFDKLGTILKDTLEKGRTIHILPQYRGDTILKIGGLLEIPPARVGDFVSEPLIKAVIAQRSVKSDEEVREIYLGRHK